MITFLLFFVGTYLSSLVVPCNSSCTLSTQPYFIVLRLHTHSHTSDKSLLKVLENIWLILWCFRTFVSNRMPTKGFCKSSWGSHRAPSPSLRVESKIPTHPLGRQPQVFEKWLTFLSLESYLDTIVSSQSSVQLVFGRWCYTRLFTRPQWYS